MLPSVRRNVDVLIEAGGFYSRKCGISISEWWGYWHVYLYAARCKRFAYGPAMMPLPPHHLLLHPVKSKTAYLSGAALPGCPGKRLLNGCSAIVVLQHFYV